MRPVLVTVVLLAVGLLLRWLPTPGVGEPLRQMAPGVLSLGALGVTPLVSAFMTVELVALLLPRGRALRVDASGRERLNRWSRRLGLAFAAVQAWGMSVWLASLAGNDLLRGEGVASTPALAAAAWAGAVMLYLLLADGISRHGVGCGLSLLLGALTLHDVATSFSKSAEARPDGLGALLGSTLLVCLFWGWVLVGYKTILRGAGTLDPVPRSEERARRSARSAGVALRLPASGSYPLHVATWLAALSGQLATLGLETKPLADLLAPFESPTVHVAVVLLVAAALGWQFYLPARMFEAARELGVEREYTRRRLRGSARRAVWSSAVLLAVLAFATHWLGFEQRQVDVLSLGLIVAVLLDVVTEVRVTFGSDPYVPVAALHRVYVTTFAAGKLESAGIPFVVRGLNHRTFGQFFAPFVPMTVLVPREHAARARELIGELC